ncbi:NTP transferase domain-containing protein [bacterium]|nr:NTP transferase domain-containing protein [bacterium]
MKQCASLILAAGKGTRMKSDLAKVLHPLDGRAMIHWVLDSAETAELSPNILVIGHQAEQVQQELSDRKVLFAFQLEQFGTGHAVIMAREEIEKLEGDLLVLSGDVPLIRPETLRGLLALHREREAAATVLSAVLEDPTGYGRVLRNEEGDLEAIREHRDASEAERKVTEINSGIYVFRIPDLLEALELLSDDNDQGEYYLTDTLEILKGLGRRVAALICPDAGEIGGINDVLQLTDAEKVLAERRG